MATRTSERRSNESDVAGVSNAKLIAVEDVAALIGCSRRHVYRMSDGDQMPRPVKLGSLTRWRRKDIDKWICDGCKPLHGTRRGRAR